MKRLGKERVRLETNSAADGFVHIYLRWTQGRIGDSIAVTCGW